MDASRFVVVRPKPTWSSIMNFQVAVRPDALVTALHVPYSPAEYGDPKHFLIGDGHGKIHVFGMDGSMQAQHQVHDYSAVTALAEVRIRYDKNTVCMEEAVCMGAGDGCILDALV